MASSSGAGDIKVYVRELEDRISNDTSLPQYIKDYRYAQLHQAQGYFLDSLHCLEKAIIGVRPFKSDFIWSGSFVSIASLLASNYDYVGRFDEAEALYSELVLCDPDGDHICDFAVFLQKRRKDFNHSQMYVFEN